MRIAIASLVVWFSPLCCQSGCADHGGSSESADDGGSGQDGDADTDTDSSAGVESDWSNIGGNAQRNGRVDVVGPGGPDLLWEGGRESTIAWPPFVDGRRVFVVRQSSSEVEDDGQTVVAMDLDTGEEEWSVDIPAEGDCSLTWIAGVGDGRVYVARSAIQSPRPLLGLDQTTGEEVWRSDADIEAFAHDGVVFASNGDPIVGDFWVVRRFGAEDGEVLWETERDCPTSGSCGAALGFDDEVYIVDGAHDGAEMGNVVVRLDGESGEVLYQGPIMPGVTNQSCALVAPDGTVYVPRTQNNPEVDLLYAFTDTGSGLERKWSEPMAWSALSEHGVAADGSVYFRGASGQMERRASADGELMATSQESIERGYLMAVDAEGKVFVTTSSVDVPGRLLVFDGDLGLLWQRDVPFTYGGGPALATDGTLIVAGIGGFLEAYRSESR